MRVPRKSRKLYTPTTRDVKVNQVFAKLAYSKDKVRSKQLSKYNADYKYDPTLSTREHAVFTNPTEHKSVIAYRGTDFSDKRRWYKDVFSDLMIATGTQGLDPRNRRSVRAYDHVKKSLPGYDVSVTGHSLGGSIANYVTNHRKSVNSAIAFSRGTGPSEILRKKSNKVLDASNRADPISMFARMQNKLQGKNQIVSKTKLGNGVSGKIGHQIEQTLPTNRLSVMYPSTDTGMKNRLTQQIAQNRMKMHTYSGEKHSFVVA